MSAFPAGKPICLTRFSLIPPTCSPLVSRRGAEAVKDLEERDGLLSVHRLQWSAPIGFKAHLPQHTL